MMKCLIVLCAIVAVTVLIVDAQNPNTQQFDRRNYNLNGRGELHDKEFVDIVKSTADRKPDGSFLFAFEGSDGSFREESGQVQNANTDDQVIEVNGSYRYYDADGQQVEVKYTAGKDGFIPVGTNISPEISEAARLGAESARNQAVEI